MTQFNEATLAQITAANPNVNAWVSANAGSGKTRVLTDRVVRLLLRETDPQRILCLTYTKAAAAEMQNRLFKRLGEWAMMPEDDLRKELLLLGETEAFLTTRKLRQARTLFAGALETPGGLKIQTIHSFCDTLLRRFPLESNISPQFEVLEDRQAKQLRSEILEEMTTSGDVEAVDALAAFFTGMDTDDILTEIVQKKETFEKSAKIEDFDQDHLISLQQLKTDVFHGSAELLRTLESVLSKGVDTDQKNSLIVKKALSADPDSRELKALEPLFFTQAGTVGKRPMPTIGNEFVTEELRERVLALSKLVQRARAKRLAEATFQRTKAIQLFANRFVQHYETRKAKSGKLDYDDLIRISSQLLTQHSMAAWVLYRLDGGLDHILVDEAQDTSPAQWQIVDHLAKEFIYGASSDESQRTLFVVGDEKQSIYSFQGADPLVFGQKKKEFSGMLLHIEQQLQDKSLQFSFRSAPPILELVDNVFTGPAGESMQVKPSHLAFNKDMAGRIDIWPFIEAEDTKNEDLWHQPNDLPTKRDPNIELAEKMAEEIQLILKSGARINKIEKSSVTAGDILILVQSRGKLFNAILKALKNKGLPVAGADRLNVGEELAVRDILSLLQFASMADDDLALAESMRSPILGLSEGNLFEVAHGRKGTLWQSLRNKEKFSEALSILKDIRSQIDFLRPYELIERILIKHQGRERLIARLGEEVEDGINELLSQAMQYEQLEAPTLTGFLNWFASGKVEIKRNMDSDANQIRLMTVHGAKGLEAPIVILPDTGQERSSPHKDQILEINGVSTWRAKKNEATEVQLNAQAELEKKEHAEKMRLLYVALTRAESWLIVCGAGKRGKKGTCWYDLIEAAAPNLTTAELRRDEKIIIYENKEWHELGLGENPIVEREIATSDPNWMHSPIASMPRPKQAIAPSKLPGAKAIFSHDGLDEEEALQRGNIVHKLLEHLVSTPTNRREKFGREILRNLTGQTEKDDEALIEVLKLLSNPELSYVFSPDSLAEVAINAPISELGRSISGFIDRLIISETKIEAIDFKSNAGIPKNADEIPAGILAQQGAYLQALKQIYPDHEINIAILWTRTGQIMSIPHKIAIKALKNAAELDHSLAGS